MLDLVTEASVPEPGDLAVLIPSWIRHLGAHNMSPRTIATYGEGVRQLHAWLIEHGMPTRVADIERQHVESFIKHHSAKMSPAKPTATGACAASSASRRSGARSRSARRRRCGHPACPRSPSPSSTTDSSRSWSPPARASAMRYFRDRAVLSLLIDSGARLSEIANLTIDDVDLDARQARVLGKGRRVRMVPFGARTASAIDRDVHAVRARSPQAKKTDRLWLSNRGPMTSSGVRFIVESRAKQAGLGHVHCHQLRHSFASGWLRNGGSEGDLMRLAGWRDRTMLNRYGAIDADDRAHASYQARQSPADRL